jgi:large subunit ribosomal protein L17
MRHKVHSHSFNRKGGPRKALIKGLVISLVEHGRIRTTLTKAKELRRHVERAVTLAKKGDIGTRRILLSKIGNDAAVSTLVNDLGKRFKARPGGYTRILKLNARPGDLAPMALIEFVDYVLPEAKKDGETTVRGDKDAVEKAKVLAKTKAKSKKARRAMQVSSRRHNLR